jgi:hypothetical protein
LKGGRIYLIGANLFPMKIILAPKIDYSL